MKTAMQELIDEIKEVVPYFKMDIYQPSFNKALEKEKEQIKDAYLQGSFDDGPDSNNSEDYYNQTFNQNK